MRVVMLAAGAGGMICGSCLRDNRLAATLRAAGRDVLLTPLYTPLKTDEPDASTGPVYYGGINVWLQQRSAFFRALPGFADRMLDAPTLLRAASGGGIQVRAEDVADLVTSVLRGMHGRQGKELKRLVAGLERLRPDLVVLPNLLFAAAASRIKEVLRVPVLCTLGGEDLFVDQLPPSTRGDALTLIREAAAHIDGFVAPTHYYARHAAALFGLPADRVHVAPLGVAVDDFAGAPSPPAAAFTIGYLARVCPEKGIHQLVEAFIALRRADRSCRLRIAGYQSRADAAHFEALLRRVGQEGYAADVDYLGEVTRAQKADFLRSVHVVSVPTVYRESKGLYVIEALAAGTPVVQPAHGSFPELIETTGGGVLYDPATPGALSAALARLMDDEALRTRLGAQGRAAVRERFTDRSMAEAAWALFERFVQRNGSAP